MKLKIPMTLKYVSYIWPTRDDGGSLIDRTHTAVLGQGLHCKSAKEGHKMLSSTLSPVIDEFF